MHLWLTSRLVSIIYFWNCSSPIGFTFEIMWYKSFGNKGPVSVMFFFFLIIEMGYYLIVLWRCMPFFTKEKKTILGVSDHILNYTEGVSRILKYTYLRFFHQWYRPNRKQGKKIKTSLIVSSVLTLTAVSSSRPLCEKRNKGCSRLFKIKSNELIFSYHMDH